VHRIESEGPPLVHPNSDDPLLRHRACLGGPPAGAAV